MMNLWSKTGGKGNVVDADEDSSSSMADSSKYSYTIGSIDLERDVMKLPTQTMDGLWTLAQNWSRSGADSNTDSASTPTDGNTWTLAQNWSKGASGSNNDSASTPNKYNIDAESDFRKLKNQTMEGLWKMLPNIARGDEERDVPNASEENTSSLAESNKYSIDSGRDLFEDNKKTSGQQGLVPIFRRKSRAKDEASQGTTGSRRSVRFQQQLEQQREVIESLDIEDEKEQALAEQGGSINPVNPVDPVDPVKEKMRDLSQRARKNCLENNLHLALADYDEMLAILNKGPRQLSHKRLVADILVRKANIHEKMNRLELAMDECCEAVGLYQQCKKEQVKKDAKRGEHTSSAASEQMEQKISMVLDNMAGIQIKLGNLDFALQLTESADKRQEQSLRAARLAQSAW